MKRDLPKYVDYLEYYIELLHKEIKSMENTIRVRRLIDQMQGFATSCIEEPPNSKWKKKLKKKHMLKLPDGIE